MQKINILTFDGHPALSPDDQLFLPFLKKEGIAFSILNWNQDPAENADGTHVLIRSPWDYHLKIDSFLKYLRVLEDRKITLINSLATVLQNYDKQYLLDLAQKNIPIIPSFILKKHQPLTKLSLWLADNELSKIVLKPTVSGSSFKTFLCSTDSQDWQPKAQEILETHDLLVQPFLPTIETAGEVSLIYFNSSVNISSAPQFSHAVLKTPKPQDFRVQAEFGGHTKPLKPSKELFTLSEKVLATLDSPWLYSRIDIVDWDTLPLISEVELIEPSLYLTYDSHAAARFAQALKLHL